MPMMKTAEEPPPVDVEKSAALRHFYTGFLFQMFNFYKNTCLTHKMNMNCRVYGFFLGLCTTAVLGLTWKKSAMVATWLAQAHFLASGTSSPT